MSAATAALLGALLAGAAAAQAPDAAWRTLATPHFRVHYTAGAEAWSRRLTGRLEAVRAAVAAEVGYAPPAPIDVVVADPEAAANGSAWPLLDTPRLVLWTTPPVARSQLGQLGDWAEQLAIHEYAHLAHLLRPSRAPWRAWAERFLLPFGPLALGAPRWAVEGYATQLEGRLTGSGRPASALRAAVLRQWGREGRLPSYSALSRDREGFLGMSMAYLAGSAFLDWLEQRAGPDASRRLWAAATARSARSFEAAFERVFGARPAVLWARFAAETTAAALAEERRRATAERIGEVWLDRRGATAELALAPDGERLAALVTDRRRAGRLVLWELATATPLPAPPAHDEPDALDPPPVPRPPARRAALAELEPAPGSSLLGARFLADGSRLLVSLVAPDRRGRRHADLALWQPGDGQPRRLTRGADVRDADPLPDGSRAIAVRWRDGSSTLAAVELATGAVDELLAPAVDVIHDRPRVAPDGATLAWLEHADGRWRVRLAALGPTAGLGPARTLAVPGDGEPVDLAWRHDGSLLYAAVARGATLEIEALPVAAAARWHQVTRSTGAALAPAPAPDGRRLWFLSLDADGLDVRRLDLDAATVQPAEPRAPLGPAPPPLAPAPVPVGRAYGLGRGEWRPWLGGWLGSGDDALELGVRAGDLLGRWELVALGATGGDATPAGGALRLSARPLPATLALHLASFRVEDERRQAAELAARSEWTLGAAALALETGVGLARAGAGGGRRERGAGFAALELRRPLARGRLRFEPRLAFAGRQGFADADFRHQAVELALVAAFDRARLALDWREHRQGRGGDEPLAVGGLVSGVAPLSARPGRLAEPALAEAALVGDRYRREQARLALGALPLELIVARHRMDALPELTLVGLEGRRRLPPLPLVGLPALELGGGVARVERDRRIETRWWLGLTLVPRPGRPGPWNG